MCKVFSLTGSRKWGFPFILHNTPPVTTSTAPVKSRVLLNIKCLKCSKVVRNRIRCDLCDRWNHFRCVNIDIPSDNEEWKCPMCMSSNMAACDDTFSVSARHHGNANIGLHELISQLQKDIDTLKEENLSLKDINKKKWNRSETKECVVCVEKGFKRVNRKVSHDTKRGPRLQGPTCKPQKCKTSKNRFCDLFSKSKKTNI